ncbi:MAG: flagellar biosynthesis repressor FlbT, partial [Pseudomonadota bacterium]
SDGASVLRMRDAIHPDEVDTPVKRLCYITQLIVAGGRAPAEDGAQRQPRHPAIEPAVGQKPNNERIERVRGLIDEKNYYLALRELRNLLPIEAILLDHEPGAFRKTA